jgi:hypothetical protein
VPSQDAGASPSDEADASAATTTVAAYLEDLVAGRYPEAWTRLAPMSQAYWASIEAYAAERAAFYRSAGTRYVLSQPDGSAGAQEAWLPAGFDGETAGVPSFSASAFHAS